MIVDGLQMDTEVSFNIFLNTLSLKLHINIAKL